MKTSTASFSPVYVPMHILDPGSVDSKQLVQTGEIHNSQSHDHGETKVEAGGYFLAVDRASYLSRHLVP